MIPQRIAYALILLCVILTVYGQLVLKWQTSLSYASGLGNYPKLYFIFAMLRNVWVWSGFVAAFGASLCWMLALTRLPLSKAYPLTASSFLLILFFSALFFGESITAVKALGTMLIVVGIILISLSA